MIRVLFHANCSLTFANDDFISEANLVGNINKNKNNVGRLLDDHIGQNFAIINKLLSVNK